MRLHQAIRLSPLVVHWLSDPTECLHRGILGRSVLRWTLGLTSCWPLMRQGFDLLTRTTATHAALSLSCQACAVPSNSVPFPPGQ